MSSPTPISYDGRKYELEQMRDDLRVSLVGVALGVWNEVAQIDLIEVLPGHLRPRPRIEASGRSARQVSARAGGAEQRGTSLEPLPDRRARRPA